jgi:hypothetical protein
MMLYEPIAKLIHTEKSPFWAISPSFSSANPLGLASSNKLWQHCCHLRTGLKIINFSGQSSFAISSHFFRSYDKIFSDFTV